MRASPPGVHVQAAEDVAEMLQYRPLIFRRLQENENRLNELLEPSPSPQMGEDFLLVLRRWNSYTPSLVVHDPVSKGGGYFLAWKGVGIVIDPGFNFIEHFHQHGLRIKDIESIFITHAHIDHCVELDSLLTLLYEYNDRRKGKPKKINLYMNIGALKKFGGWITSCHMGVIHKIHMLEGPVPMHGKLITKQMPSIGNARISVKSAPALHNEIWSEEYSVGLIFKLFSSDDPKKPVVRIGITSDTRWQREIQEHYKSCDLMVFHLGGVQRREIFSTLPVTDNRRLYKNHLGAVGTTLMMHNLMETGPRPRLKLAVVSEFGEELKGLRKEIIDVVRGAIGDQLRVEPEELRCVIGDVGTKIMLPASRLRCEQRECNEEAELEDVILKGGSIAHFCQRHSPILSDIELLEAI